MAAFSLLLLIVCGVLGYVQCALPGLLPIETNSAITNKVLCTTTKGDIVIDVHADWSPIGADHFVGLVNQGFYSDIALFRSVDNFLTQFGISDKPEHSKRGRVLIKDDEPLGIPIRKGYISYAGSGPNSRNTQIFIAYADLDFLGKEPWETPFASIELTPHHTAVLSTLHKMDDIAPFGSGPDQTRLMSEGNRYIRDNFPQTDFLLSCAILADDVKLTAEDHGRRELQAAAEAAAGAAGAAAAGVAGAAAGIAGAAAGIAGVGGNFAEKMKLGVLGMKVPRLDDGGVPPVPREPIEYGHIDTAAIKIAHGFIAASNSLNEKMAVMSNITAGAIAPINRGMAAVKSASDSVNAHLDSRRTKTFAEVQALKEVEDSRRAHGEVVVEELSPEELAMYYTEMRNHHGPVEVPPGEFVIILVFAAFVYVIWTATKRKAALEVKRQ